MVHIFCENQKPKWCNGAMVRNSYGRQFFASEAAEPSGQVVLTSLTTCPDNVDSIPGFVDTP